MILEAYLITVVKTPLKLDYQYSCSFFLGEPSENLNIAAAPATDGSKAKVKFPLSHKDDAQSAEKQDQITAILQFIPRKRTNTDHVITPKKPLRQTTLDQKEEAPSVTKHPNGIVAKTTRPRKSLRKSMIASISDNTSAPKTSKAQTRFSSGAEHLSSIEGAASDANELETIVRESTSKRRVLRRSTITTRRSIAHAKQPSDVEQIRSQGTELDPQDATKLVVSISANSITSGELLTSSGPDEVPGTGNTNLCDMTGLDLTLPSEAIIERERSLEIPAHVLTSNADSQVLDAIDVKSPEISVNCGEDVGSTKVIRIKGNVSNLLDITHDKTANVLESQNKSSEFQDSTTSKAEQQLVTCEDTSNAEGAVIMADGGSLAGNVASPIPTGRTISLDSGDNVQQTESNDSSEAPVELDVHQVIQNVEAPDIPDSSSLATSYDHDDTDMLRNFLTRVKANKAAKNPPKRKRSLPHSPLRIPLGDLGNNASPSPLQLQKVSELEVAEPSPSKRKKKPSPLAQCENEPEPRRSGRTRPPVKEPPGVPSFIPVRRLGQDIDTTVTLKRNEEKELAALTRVNTRKNKGNALTALEVLAKKSEEKEDPVMRQRLLKEVFDEKMERGRQDKEKKGREKKSVTWAEELAQFQTLTKGKPGEDTDDKENVKEKVVVVQGGEDKKQGAVRVGVRSKAALGMALNGTPAPKRKMRGRV
jgi:hypothetical protein